jgi:ABC-2 type transport system permease protein
MHALRLLTIANIKSFTRDRAALFWTLAFPLIFVVLFGSIFSGGSDERTIGYADQDGSPASQQLASPVSFAGRRRLPRRGHSKLRA